jgi:hypothetical protein
MAPRSDKGFKEAATGGKERKKRDKRKDDVK